MADDIGGLSVSFTAEAAQLQNELKRMEQQLRAFDRAHSKHTVQLSANIREPGSRALADARVGIQRKLDEGAPIRFTPKLNPPAREALDAFSATLGRRIPPTTVRVKGIWAGWETPPPKSITMGVAGVSGASGRGTGTVAATGVLSEPAATRTTTRTSRDEINRAREANRRRERTGAAPPAPRAQTAARPPSGNAAKAAAQT